MAPFIPIATSRNCKNMKPGNKYFYSGHIRTFNTKERLPI